MGLARAAFFAATNAAAKGTVEGPVAAAGPEPLDVGPLRNARKLEARAMLWIDLAVTQRKRPSFVFNLVSRSQGGSA